MLPLKAIRRCYNQIIYYINVYGEMYLYIIVKVILFVTLRYTEIISSKKNQSTKCPYHYKSFNPHYVSFIILYF